MLYHQNGVRPAGQRSAGRDRRRAAGDKRDLRRYATMHDLVIQPQDHRAGWPGARQITRKYSEAVNVGAIKRRRVNGRSDIIRKRQIQSVQQCTRNNLLLARKHCAFKSRKRILAAQNIKKLFLMKITSPRHERALHWPGRGNGRTTAPSASPSLPAPSSRYPSARNACATDISPASDGAQPLELRSIRTTSLIPGAEDTLRNRGPLCSGSG